MPISRTLSAAGLVALLSVGTAHASLVTGVADPEYNHVFQGASAATLAGFGYSVGTGPTDLKVYTNTWTDPSGLTFGTLINPTSVAGVGQTTGLLDYGYNDPAGTTANGNARDYFWIQNTGPNLGTNPADDTPWTGNIFDLGGQANQAVVFPIIDHGPLPGEAGEYTVYLTNNPSSTNLSDWTLATLDSIYLEGWQPDNIAIADGFTTVWKLPGNQTFQYVSVEAVGSNAIPGYVGNEDEIDAVAGLTAAGNSVSSVPEPSTWLLLGSGLVGLAAWRRKKAA